MVVAASRRNPASTGLRRVPGERQGIDKYHWSAMFGYGRPVVVIMQIRRVFDDDVSDTAEGAAR